MARAIAELAVQYSPSIWKRIIREMPEFKTIERPNEGLSMPTKLRQIFAAALGSQGDGRFVHF